MTAIVLFTLASAVCAVSVNLPMLTAARVAQGAAGAMMVPVGRLAVLRVIAKADLVKAIAFLTWPALIAPVIAPALGGALATYGTWHWIFLINVPFGVAAFVVALRIFPTDPAIGRPPLDWVGLLLTSTGVTALISVATTLQADRQRWLTNIGLLLLSLCLLGGAVRHLLRTNNALLDLRVMRIVTFRISTSSGAVFRLTINAVPFLLPLLFQEAFGWTAFHAGLMVLGVFVGNIAIKPFTTPLLAHLGFRNTLLIATVSTCLTIALCGLLRASTPQAIIAALMVSSGVARSIGFTAYNTIAFADVERGAMSKANTLFATVQQMGIGLGVAVGAVFLRTGGPIADLFGLDQARVSAYRIAFVLLAMLSLLAVIGAVRLPASAGAGIRPSGPSGRRRTTRAEVSAPA